MQFLPEAVAPADAVLPIVVITAWRVYTTLGGKPCVRLADLDVK